MGIQTRQELLKTRRLLRKACRYFKIHWVKEVPLEVAHEDHHFMLGWESMFHELGHWWHLFNIRPHVRMPTGLARYVSLILTGRDDDQLNDSEVFAAAFEVKLAEAFGLEIKPLSLACVMLEHGNVTADYTRDARYLAKAIVRRTRDLRMPECVAEAKKYIEEIGRKRGTRRSTQGARRARSCAAHPSRGT